MTHGSVFSGIGGPEVAASMLGWENLFHCEINPFGRKILDYYYPNAESYEDITKTDFTKWRGRVNVLTGGFPCQPFSYAGNRRGEDDERYLWPHMHRCINEIQPDWVVCENVGGILSMVEQGEVAPMASAPSLFGEDDGVHRYRYRGTFTLERICRDIEADGYEVQPILIPACAVGAPHRRDRVFFVARNTRNSGGRSGQSSKEHADGRSVEHSSSGRAEVTNNASRPTQDERQGFGNFVGGSAADTKGFGQFDGDRQERPDLLGRPHLAQAERSINALVGNGESGFATDPQDYGRASDNGGQGRDNQRPASDSQGRIVQPMSDGFGSAGYAPDSRMDDAQRRASASYTENDGGSGKSCEESGSMSGQDGRQMGEPRFNGGVWWIPRGDAAESYLAPENRWRDFPTVPPIHRGNDGLPFNVDNLTIPFNEWRNESLKAYGNAIVPQVMYEIFRAIEIVEEK